MSIKNKWVVGTVEKIEGDTMKFGYFPEKYREECEIWIDKDSDRIALEGTMVGNKIRKETGQRN